MVPLLPDRGSDHDHSPHGQPDGAERAALQGSFGHGRNCGNRWNGNHESVAADPMAPAHHRQEGDVVLLAGRGAFHAAIFLCARRVWLFPYQKGGVASEARLVSKVARLLILRAHSRLHVLHCFILLRQVHQKTLQESRVVERKKAEISFAVLKLLTGRSGVWKMTKLGLPTEIGTSCEMWGLRPQERYIF